MAQNKPFDIKLRSFEFALDCLRYCKTISTEYKEYILTKQLSRLATSVGANIREAQNSNTKKDFIHKLSIAQKECNESLYWIELIKVFLEGNSEENLKLQKEANELLLILSSIILKTKQKILSE
jgi:four helix bundle protein